MNRSILGVSVAAALASITACGTDPGTGSDIGSSSALDAGGAPDAGSDAAPGLGANQPETGTGVQVDPNCTASGDDRDGDGFSVAQGDCNDCDKNVNPGAYDFPGNNFDEDCSGQPAESALAECDKGLDIASSAAEDAARAIGLCKFTSADKRDWGVIEARFTTADGTGTLDSPLQVGLLPKFGAADPRAGAAFLALSSGVARAPDQPGYTRSTNDDFGADRLGHPPIEGFPKPSSVCPSTPVDAFFRKVLNQAALEVKVRVPTNASSLSFDSIFYSYEYPDYICQPGNDFFVAVIAPHASGDGNVVFDTNGDPIGVNNGLLAVCDPAQQSPEAAKQFECAQGTALLSGTGFGPGEYAEPSFLGESPGKGGASTGWLTTTAPVNAGSVITLRFAIWDTGDGKMDSTVLIDRFLWSIEQPTTPTTKPTPVLL